MRGKHHQLPVEPLEGTNSSGPLAPDETGTTGRQLATARPRPTTDSEETIDLTP
jgi:hypothetical protein